MLNGEAMTLARITLAAGAVVPEHRHENEQIATVLSGRLRFVIGDEEREVGAARACSCPAASRTAWWRSRTRSCSMRSRRAARTGSAATTHTSAASTERVTDDLDPLEQHLVDGLRSLARRRTRARAAARGRVAWRSAAREPRDRPRRPLAAGTQARLLHDRLGRSRVERLRRARLAHDRPGAAPLPVRRLLPRPGAAGRTRRRLGRPPRHGCRRGGADRRADVTRSSGTTTWR